MCSLARSTVVARLTRVREQLRAAALDALVVTHLPNIRYLTGFSGTAGVVIVAPSRCFLIVDFRYLAAAQDIASAAADAITVERVQRTYEDAVVTVLQQESPLRIGIEAGSMSVARFNAIAAGLAATAPFPLQSDDPMPVLVPTERLIEGLRIIKDADEVATLREAARRLSTIAQRLSTFVSPGLRERDIAFALQLAMRDAGFSRPAFETIVASGPHSALPHARPTDRRVEPGDPTVLDFGGVYDGYCVDLTRTVQLGAPSEPLRRLYLAVEEAQRTALATVRAGVRPSAIDAAARQILQAHGFGDAFGHGTGHGLGLEVHEEPRIAREIAGHPDDPVQPGMVFTIEPGAYLPGIGGVRIEDDVLVTATGCEVLTDAPKRIEVRKLSNLGIG